MFIIALSLQLSYLSLLVLLRIQLQISSVTAFNPVCFTVVLLAQASMIIVCLYQASIITTTIKVLTIRAYCQKAFNQVSLGLA